VAAAAPQRGQSPGGSWAKERGPRSTITVNGVTSYANDHYRLWGGVSEGFCVAEASVARSAMSAAASAAKRSTLFPRSRGRCECCRRGAVLSKSLNQRALEWTTFVPRDDERLDDLSTTCRPATPCAAQIRTARWPPHPRTISRVSGSMGEGSKTHVEISSGFRGRCMNHDARTSICVLGLQHPLNDIGEAVRERLSLCSLDHCGRRQPRPTPPLEWDRACCA